MGIGDAIVELRLDPAKRLEAAVRLVGDAIVNARSSGARGVLVVVPPDWALPPTTAERVSMVRTWASLAGGRVRLAMVAPPGLLDEQRVGVVAARGFGLAGEVFEDEDEARRWLAEPA